MTRIAFLGTPDAAVPTLRALAAAYEVPLVLTQPDRPRGRSGKPAPSPVKVAATTLGLEVAQPATSAGVLDALSSAGPLDLAIVVAYGRILSAEVLGVPDLGIVNVHFSLLPRWRGAAPVARALMSGDTMTGVTLIRLDEGLDTGPVLTAQAIDILADETAGELTARLSVLGARLLIATLPGYLSSALVPVAQSDEGATYAAKIEPSDRPLDVAGPREDAHHRVRALAPEPGATLVLDGDTHQVLRTRLHELSPGPGRWQAGDEGPVAGFSDGGLELVEIQPPGKRPMRGADWIRGQRRQAGEVG